MRKILPRGTGLCSIDMLGVVALLVLWIKEAVMAAVLT